MGKKKQGPREIPIDFAEQDGESEINQADSDPQQAGQPLRDKAESDRDDKQVSEVQVAPADQAQVDLDELSQTWDAAWAGLQARVNELAQEKAALYEQMLRRQAEFENYRKRTERERSDLYQRARADVLLELLPVIDNFERALLSAGAGGAEAEGLRHGLALIHKQFKDALTKLGLQPVESVGQTFDPHLHEAVTIEPSSEHEENTIIEEFERGYKLGDRLLRPAKVKVASAPNG